jgi:CP family cyanate transporter-like MFS transporter
VVLAGVCAALHVGKLPPAIPALQRRAGHDAGAGGVPAVAGAAGRAWLLGVAFGVVADGMGARRSMVLGLGVLTVRQRLGRLGRGVPAS